MMQADVGVPARCLLGSMLLPHNSYFDNALIYYIDTHNWVCAVSLKLCDSFIIRPLQPCARFGHEDLHFVTVKEAFSCVR